MKIIKSLVAIAIFFTLNSVSAQSVLERWPEMKTYHEIISKSFHAAEKGNLDIIKTNSENLVANAELMVVENMPEEYRKPKTIETLVELKRKTKVVNDLVQRKAADNDIKTALFKLHDVYHKIIGTCEPPNK